MERWADAARASWTPSLRSSAKSPSSATPALPPPSASASRRASSSCSRVSKGRARARRQDPGAPGSRRAVGGRSARNARVLQAEDRSREPAAHGPRPASHRRTGQGARSARGAAEAALEALEPCGIEADARALLARTLETRSLPLAQRSSTAGAVQAPLCFELRGRASNASRPVGPGARPRRTPRARPGLRRRGQGRPRRGRAGRSRARQGPAARARHGLVFSGLVALHEPQRSRPRRRGAEQRRSRELDLWLRPGCSTRAAPRRGSATPTRRGRCSSACAASTPRAPSPKRANTRSRRRTTSTVASRRLRRRSTRASPAAARRRSSPGHAFDERAVSWLAFGENSRLPLARRSPSSTQRDRSSTRPATTSCSR